MILTIVCVLHCCTQVRLSHPMTDKDKQVVVTARQTCGLTYEKSPCLIKLTSKEDSVYTALCGAENN